MTGAIKVTPRPYRLENEIQHYTWGTRGPDAFIPRLLGIEPEPGTPYAELWMGAHPKAPSRVVLPDGSTVPLPVFIETDPQNTLGRSVRDRFGELPFLFKVLSAGQALSIQAHPNKAQAERLHARDPEHYPDDNPKPEIAVALDGLTALMGFKPFAELRATLARYPELSGFVGKAAHHILEAREASVDARVQATHRLFEALLIRAAADPAGLRDAVDRLTQRLSAQVYRVSEAERRFLEVQRQYGSCDVGVLAFFLFNLVHLKPGEGIFTRAGVPHAYLEGNIIECMANSDNVVRVGLTSKYRDAEALLEIIDATPREPEILEGAPPAGQEKVSATVYRTPTPEFQVWHWKLARGSEEHVERPPIPAILLAAEGTGELIWDPEAHMEGRVTLQRGESVFLPACLRRHVIRASGTSDVELFEALVPLTEE